LRADFTIGSEAVKKIPNLLILKHLLVKICFLQVALLANTYLLISLFPLTIYPANIKMRVLIILPI